MRFVVDVTSIGKAEKESFCVEAESWQRALQQTRTLRNDNGPMNGFSIELLDDGCRAVDPMSRLRYEVRRAGDDVPLSPAAPAAAPVAAKASTSTPPPPSTNGAKAKELEKKKEAEKKKTDGDKKKDGDKGRSRPPSSAPKPPRASENPPPVAASASAKRTMIMGSAGSSGAAVVQQKEATPAATTAVIAAAVASVEPEVPSVAPVSSQVIFKREQDATPSMPITYREYVYAVAAGTSDSDAELLLLAQLEQIKRSVAAAEPGKLVHLAVFDVVYKGKPTVLPLATLAWKDWRGAPSIVHPRRAPASAHAASAPSAPPPPSAPVATAAPVGTSTLVMPVAPPPNAQHAPAPVSAPPPAPSFPPVAAAPVIAAPTVVQSSPPRAAQSAPPAAVAPSAPPAAPAARVAPASVPPPAPVATAPTPSFPAPAPKSVPPPAKAVSSSGSPPAVASADPFASTLPMPTTGFDASRTIPQRPSAGPMRAASPSTPRGRMSGDELIADLFEAMHDLHFLGDAVDGGMFCLNLAHEKLPSRVGLVHLYDINKREFLVTSALGAGADKLLLARHTESDPILMAAMRTRRAIVLEDAAVSEAAGLERFHSLGGVRSLMVAPVMQAGRFLGAIELVDPLDGQPFTDQEGHALQYIAEQFAEYVASRGVVTDPARISMAPGALR